ncbi:MAG: hypothetical protein MJ252_20660, partial [archaeon]|nr:hypothetical protein [archaeon]
SLFKSTDEDNFKQKITRNKNINMTTQNKSNSYKTIQVENRIPFSTHNSKPIIPYNNTYIKKNVPYKNIRKENTPKNKIFYKYPLEIDYSINIENSKRRKTVDNKTSLKKMILNENNKSNFKQYTPKEFKIKNERRNKQRINYNYSYDNELYQTESVETGTFVFN